MALLSSKAVAQGAAACGARPTGAVARVVAGARRCPQAKRPTTIAHAAPVKESWQASIHGPVEQSFRAGLPSLISKEQVVQLEAELDQGPSIRALRRFNDNLRNIPADRWEAVLKPVFNELCYNLESFNPAFTSCLLMVQQSIGRSDYVRRDMALKNLIQPLAGEYGMHNSQPQLKTHRELFADFYASLFGTPLEDLIAAQPEPPASVKMFRAMRRDILNGGMQFPDVVEQASYALGYNLAIEYLADYEKTWMLDSFRALDSRIFSGLGKKVDWIFLEVHAEGEAEHAAIGHNAVLNFVPEAHMGILRQAMRDHDRDFADFYNHLANLLEAKH